MHEAMSARFLPTFDEDDDSELSDIDTGIAELGEPPDAFAEPPEIRRTPAQMRAARQARQANPAYKAARDAVSDAEIDAEVNKMVNAGARARAEAATGSNASKVGAVDGMNTKK